MDAARRRAGTIVWVVAGAVFLVDRATKAWAVDALAERPIDVIGGVLTFRYAENTGGAFSLFTSIPWFFAAAATIVAAAIAATSFRARPTLQSVAFGLILGGAVGNLWDRATRGPWFGGHVVDFIDVHVWPIFNVADAAVVIGAIVLAVSAFASREHAPHPDVA
jgi:signal peptidase II